MIGDFQRGQDRIDLGAIDADPAAPGSQDFAFLGAGPFTGNAGELRFANGVVAGDLDGDALADFEIAVHGVDRLAAADLLL